MIISRRLEKVVQIVFDGNVTAAADAADVPIPTLHRILDGSVESPRLATLRRLADGFGLPLGWILGDMSTLQAQSTGPHVIPEDIWLIYVFHTHRQADLRERIAAFEPNSAEGKRLKGDFINFNFLPFASEEPVSEALDYLSTRFDPSNKRDLALIRQWADLSTQFLETAFQKMKAAQTRDKG